MSDIFVYFDVDRTLVFGPNDPKPKNPGPTVDIGGVSFVTSAKHTQEIKTFYARGHTVVVWSAGGAEWARAVCEALGVLDCVDFCLSKPHWFVDDAKAEKFLPETNRVYLEEIE